MGMIKNNNNNFLYLAILVLFAVFWQLLMSPGFFPDTDSFYYSTCTSGCGIFSLTNSVSPGFTWAILRIMIILNAALMFIIMMKVSGSVPKSYIFTFFYIISPTVFSFMNFSYFDKTPIYILSFFVLLLAFLFMFENKMKKFLITASIFIIFGLMIDLQAMLWILFMIVVVFMINNEKPKHIFILGFVISLLTVLIVLMNWKYFILYFNTMKYVTELWPGFFFFSGEILMIYASVYIICINRKIYADMKNHKTLFAVTLFYVSLCLYLVFYKFVYFMIPSFYIAMSTLKLRKQIVWYISIFISVFILLSYPLYLPQPVFDDDTFSMIKQIEDNGIPCVYTGYGMGNFIEYNTNMTAVFKGHVTDDENSLITTGYYDGMRTDCVFLYTKDYHDAWTMLYPEIFFKLRNNESTMFYYEDAKPGWVIFA